MLTCSARYLLGSEEVTDMLTLIELGRSAWDAHWPKIRHAPILQSWEYGEAKRRAQGCRPQRFLLQDEGRPLGLLQALVYSLPLIGGVARINRGPVFFSDSLRVSPLRQQVEAIMNAVRETARQERWRLLRILPEFVDADGDLSRMLIDLGFRKRTAPETASAVIDIARLPEKIRAGFHGKWRNLLNKAEKMDLELESSCLEDALSFLILRYETMQRRIGFKGIPTALLRAVASQQGPTWNCKILFACHHGRRHGAIMVIGHGDTCTYLIAWTSEDGRRLQANYFLLWQAMLLFREMGYSFFDVGGLGANTTEGVEHFKKRLQGQEYCLIGEYSYSTIPWIR